MSYPKHERGPSCAGCDSRLLEACQTLRDFFYWAKAIHPDLHCACAYRGEAEQNAAKASDASNLKFGESKHNVLPTKAIDVFQITDLAPLGLWEPKFCVTLYKDALAAGFVLKNGGDFKIRKNGKTVSLGDYGHFEVD